MSKMEILEEMLRYIESEQKHGRLLTVSFFDVIEAADSLEQTMALLEPAVFLPPKVGVFRRIAARAKKLILASASFTAGLFVGASIMLPIFAHASEYTAVGRDTQGEIMWRRLEVLEVDGRWCGKGLARFEGVKVEVVK